MQLAIAIVGGVGLLGVVLVFCFWNKDEDTGFLASWLVSLLAFAAVFVLALVK